MRRLSFLTLLAPLLALPACIVNHELGETAEDGSSTDGTGETGPDPSATSGTPPGDSSGSTTGSTTIGESGMPMPTTAEGGSESSGTDGEPLCEPGEMWVQLNDPFPEPLPGINASFLAVLEGECSLSGSFSGQAKKGAPWQWEIYLDCTLSGQIDGGPVTDQPFSPVLQGTSAIPLEQWAPFFEEQPLRLRVVLDHWGMGWNRYLVLHRGPDIMLDMVEAEYVDPRLGSSGLEDIDDLLGEQPWHDTLAVDVADSECGTELGECGASPRALELGWDGSPGSLALHDGQDGSFGSDVEELFYQAWVGSAQDLSMPMCTDMPLGDYRFSVWAMEP